jgi:tRNA/tmRNA/rRNA uracil-C5-methylase (TrmA/RlmC/RlmD family)
VTGETIRVVVERVAHGGHCVARHEGRVVFVRHALPGEVVDAVITGEGPRGKFLRADAVTVVEASPDRVPAPCEHARPGGCGGCDWQHVAPARQRELKAEVLREQLERLGGVREIGGRPLTEAVVVEQVAGDRDGLAWRTRVSYAVDDAGTVGLRRHRSHEVEPLDRCPLVTDEVDEVGVTRRGWPGSERIDVVATSMGQRALLVHPSTPRDAARGLPEDVAVPGTRGRRWVAERAGGRDWRVDAAGFWQVHPGAADTLVSAVHQALRPRPGEHLLDLYAGVGLFAGALAEDLGTDGTVDAVEASARACADARRNLHDLRGVRIHERAVASWLRHEAPDRADIVVLDPPRSGAGAEVMGAVLALRPRAVAYVACDPAALGRDVGIAREAGWELRSVRGFDLFPMTQHVEAVALLVP